MQPQENPCRVILGLHGDCTEGFFLKNLYCLDCILEFFCHAHNSQSRENHSRIVVILIQSFNICNFYLRLYRNIQRNQTKFEPTVVSLHPYFQNLALQQRYDALKIQYLQQMSSKHTKSSLLLVDSDGLISFVLLCMA